MDSPSFNERNIDIVTDFNKRIITINMANTSVIGLLALVLMLSLAGKVNRDEHVGPLPEKAHDPDHHNMMINSEDEYFDYL